MAGGSGGKKRVGRSYRPTLEAMEALRLLSGATATSLPGLVAEHNVLPEHVPTAMPATELPSVSGDTWDAALFQTHLADILSGTAGTTPTVTAGSGGAATTPTTTDTAALNSGLNQLNKYLSRAWYRAGIPMQMHEDCSQAVYATLLQQLGRNRFDSLVGDIGHSGIKDVFSRETDEGIDFFRAVDMIKKRAQRERVYQPLDAVDVPASSTSSESARLARRPQRGHRPIPQPTRGQPDPRDLDGQDPRRDRPPLGRRPQDDQQREDPGHPEAPRCLAGARGRLMRLFASSSSG